MRIQIAVCCALLILVAFEAEAGRRSIRIEFAAWDEAQGLGGPGCPLWSGGGTVFWNGWEFSGAEGDTYLVDAYCQYPFYHSAGIPDDAYLNEAIFPPDEAGLAAKIGPNTDSAVTAVRYTFLDRDRFSENPVPEGFQWAFYFFPDNITIVALYGLEGVPLNMADHHVSQGAFLAWDGARDGFDGEYFCFDGNEFIGVWDGATVPGGPEAGCDIVTGELILQDGFEVSVVSLHSISR